MILQSSASEEDLSSINTNLSRRYYTQGMPLGDKKWPNGEVLWCLVQEWPVDMVAPSQYGTGGQPDWVKVMKDVHDMIEDAMWEWNPDKKANIWHKPCGICPCSQGHALQVRANSMYHTTQSPSGAAGNFVLHFRPEDDHVELKEHDWRHEWGHVLGFFHEHSRPDLWQSDSWAFILLIENFPDFQNFFHCEMGLKLGKPIPADVRQRMEDFRRGHPTAYPETDTFDYDLMRNNYFYATKAGASWSEFLPNLFWSADIDTGDGLGGRGVDADAVMLYGTRQAAWSDPTMPDGIRVAFTWAEPRHYPQQGRTTRWIHLNKHPSAGERARLEVMYPR